MLQHVPGSVEITCTDVRAFKQWTRDSFARAVETVNEAGRRFEAGGMSRAAFNEVETAIGFRSNPFGIVADVALCDLIKPEESFAWDWVHTMLQGGVLTVEIECVLEATSTTKAAVQEFLGDEQWCFPLQTRGKSRSLHRIFDERRAPQDDLKIKASCSELLGVYGLLRFFFTATLAENADMANYLNSFLALCSVIDLLLAAKRRVASLHRLADELDLQVQKFLDAHIRCYGREHVRPKHHWLMDISWQIRRHNLVLDAFVIERIHLRIKAIADKVRKTTSYERSVLNGTLASQLSAMESQVATGGLLGKTAPMARVPGAMLADRMEVAGIEMRVGDILILGEFPGLLVACAYESGECFAMVRALTKIGEVTPTVGRYGDSENLEVWLALSCLPAIAWRHEADGRILVVRR